MNKFSEEEKYLEYALDSINEQINIAEEKANSLIKEGISLSYEDAKRGEHLTINAKIDFYKDIIKKLKHLIPSPYFGRFDFCSENNKLSKIYIGKSSVIHNGNFVVTDWRAPICSLYYDSEVGDVEYESPSGIIKGKINLKRQINIEDSKLIDVIDSNLVTNDDLLNKYLNVNADNKMKTIIQSIQKEQNKIIRRDINDNLIIQGVAGSGKTSVALHRIAYLIYKLEDEINSNQFLVLGPNDYFLNYISSILPELETEPVEQKTLLNLTNEYLDEKLSYADLSNKKIGQDVFEKIQAYKSSLEYKNALDKFIEYYIQEGIVSNGFELEGEVIFTPDEIKEILFSISESQPNFENATQYFVNKFKLNMNTIYSKLNKKYRDVYLNLPKDSLERKEAIKKSFELEKFVKESGVKLLKNYFKKLQVKPVDLYKIFIASLPNYVITLSNEEIEYLQKETLLQLKKKKVSFEDIPALMHINYCLTGKKIKYKHIVIDEAQDYGLFHFDIIKEISPKNSTFSVYGDLAQSIYSYRSIDSWENVNEEIFNNNCDILNLSKSYRTTIEITNNANKILDQINLSVANPVIRHGKDVEFIDVYNDSLYKIDKINEWVRKGYKTIAIICKTEKEAKDAYNDLIKNGIDVKYISATDEQYNGGIFVLTSASAKGLEFDAVIINDASNKNYSSDSKLDMHLLYVACTRALHEQVILYNKQLTKVFDNNLIKEKQKVKKFSK